MSAKEAEPEKPAAKLRGFPGQHEGEVVQLVFHRHPIVMRKALIFGMLAILLGVMPLLVWPLSDIAVKIAIFVPFIVLAYWLYSWVGWYYTVYIVTQERIVEIKQKGFFNRKVSEFGLDKVQNINYHIKGFQAAVFQFGDITVQTYVGDMEMSTIHKPAHIHEQLVAIVRRFAQADPAD